MAIEPLIPIVLVQDMGPTGKLAHDATTRPEAAQAMARVVAEETLKEESRQIQKPEHSENSGTINDEGGGNAQHGHHGKRKRKPDEEAETPPRPSGDPFVGKLVNKKI